MKYEQAGKILESLNRTSDKFGEILVESFHSLTLFAIGAAIVWSGVYTFLGMVFSGMISIEDILLLFIYLELLAMVGIYFKTNHMPVRFLIYVGITGLTRMLLIDIQHDHNPDVGIIYIAVTILILTLAILVIRFGSYKYPYGEPVEEPD